MNDSCISSLLAKNKLSVAQELLILTRAAWRLVPIAAKEPNTNANQLIWELKQLERTVATGISFNGTSLVMFFPSNKAETKIKKFFVELSKKSRSKCGHESSVDIAGLLETYLGEFKNEHSDVFDAARESLQSDLKQISELAKTPHPDDLGEIWPIKNPCSEEYWKTTIELREEYERNEHRAIDSLTQELSISEFAALLEETCDPFSREEIDTIIHTAFLASLEVEEGRPVRINVALLSEEKEAVLFQDSHDLAAKQFVKLSPMIGTDFRHLVVRTIEGQMKITGILEQGLDYE